MKLLSIFLENCYGIKKLTHTFDFSNPKKNVYSIYAPNGFMKTSFSKTFRDLEQGHKSNDKIYPDRASTRTIQDEKKVDIEAGNIFVIEAMKDDYQSPLAALLLVNPELKKKFDESLRKIEHSKNSLIQKLKIPSGLTGKTITPETEILKCFSSNSIFDLLEEIEEDVLKHDNFVISNIKYSEIFEQKNLAFLESGEIKNQLHEYIEKYNELVDKSPLLSKTFNHHQAKSIQKSLGENGFFSAKHTINLFNGLTRDEMLSPEQFDQKIEEEKNKIITDESLQKKFDAIEKKLTTNDLRKFRDYLVDNPHIVPELADIKKLQKSIWLAYLKNEVDLYKTLVAEYKVEKGVINDAVQAAKAEETEWRKVVAIFNKRFSVPFLLSVENQHDVILQEATPNIVFTFKDEDNPVRVDKNNLLDVLSQGEKRALYILNILFEINARKNNHRETLLIVDDIADSFDYKNKYAIIEYLREISKYENFSFIFLTHNFDFYRTIATRLKIPRENNLAVHKIGREISFSVGKYQGNPFITWTNQLTRPAHLIASIAFVRNLAEFCRIKDEYEKLTSLLHIKLESETITVGELQDIFKAVLRNLDALDLPDKDKPVLMLIFDVANTIYLDQENSPDLEGKIVLAIAIRLYAEKYMIKRINDPAFVEALETVQTIQLFERFEESFPLEEENIQKLQQVNLMTPENIHLNSFMFEPILDMDPESLKSLFSSIKELEAAA